MSNFKESYFLLKKSLLFLFILFLIDLSCFHKLASAQTAEEAELQIGGKAVCRFSGGLEKFNKKIKSKGNSFLIDLSNDNVEFTIEAESTLADTNFSISLFIPVFDIDTMALLSGEVIRTNSDEVEFNLVKLSNGKNVEIMNSTEDGNGNPLESSILIQIANYNEIKNQASGNIKIRFPNTVSVVDDSEEEIDNGKMIVTCKFNNVPLTVNDDVVDNSF